MRVREWMQRGKHARLLSARDLDAARPSLATTFSVDELSCKWAHIPVAEVMGRELITVAPRTSVVEAARVMRDQKVDTLPGLDDGKLVGILTVIDLIRVLEIVLDKKQEALRALVA